MRGPIRSSRARAAALVPLLAAGLAGGLAGCLFEPREPEASGGEACFVATPAEEPLRVIANLDGSLECLQAAEYMRQISPNFAYIPAPSVLAAYPELFAPEGAWGESEENSFISTLSGGAATAVDSALLERLIDRSGTAEVLIEGEYRVAVTADGSQIEYTGEAFYTFRQEQTVWVLVRWEEKEAASPLGALKAALVSGR